MFVTTRTRTAASVSAAKAAACCHEVARDPAQTRLEPWPAPPEDPRAIANRPKGPPVDALYLYFVKRADRIRRLLEGGRSERGQGTVEYVGLILLVSMLMVGMVAAMKGFNGTSGTEIAEVIISKIKQAVNAITFR